MKDLLIKFIESPGAITYLAIRQAIISSDGYNPYSDEMSDIDELLDGGRYEDARNRISESMPNLLLSPRAHLLLAIIAEKAGDEKAVHMERFLASACAKGILATGDGSRDRPYMVLRISDEYDVVQYLGKKLMQQSLIGVEGRDFDVINCDDGTELWFDITEPLNKRREIFGG